MYEPFGTSLLLIHLYYLVKFLPIRICSYCIQIIRYKIETRFKRIYEYYKKFCHDIAVYVP